MTAEAQRLRVLAEYEIVGTEAEAAFDEIVDFAARLCEAPTALISFIQADRQWFKARVGMEAQETSREVAFCVHCLERLDVMEVPDATRDPRFMRNPLVTGEPGIRFYAGCALRAPTGEALGSICVIDTVARPAGLTELQREGLRVLASQVMAQLETRRLLLQERRREEHMRRALEAAQFVGTWDWDIAADRVKTDARFAELFQLDAAAAAAGLPLETFFARIHPADRERVKVAVREAVERGDIYRNEQRLLLPDGTVRWILVNGKVERSAEGNAIRLPGVAVDITDQKAGEAALSLSEARFRALADSMPQMVWSTLPDGFHDYYNARWYEFTGVPDGSTDGEGWNGMFHPEDQPRAWERWRHSLETGEPYEIEYRLRHRSGEYRWTLGRALPIRDSSGTILRWFGTCTDIHEARLSAAEKELLAQELSHRIKNIFSVIGGLLSLTSRTDPATRPALDRLRERILALGKAHDFVRPHSPSSRPRAGENTLHGLLEALLAPYGGADGASLRISGDDLAVDDRAATPLALLFHELATNAAKYGAFAREGGVVRCDIAVKGETVDILWQEEGGPKAVLPDGAGFGTRLIDISVAAQLGGTVEREWKPEGLAVTARIPKASFSREGG